MSGLLFHAACYCLKPAWLTMECRKPFDLWLLIPRAHKTMGFGESLRQLASRIETLSMMERCLGPQNGSEPPKHLEYPSNW
eukprot:463677-Amphidinium_carterae.1